MNALASPIDALALGYLSYGFLTAVINNIWTWIAVATAAVSFWRIRALSSPIVPEQRSSAASTSTPPPRMPGAKPATFSAPPTLPCVADCGEGSPKVKFSVYFNEDDLNGIDEEEEEDEVSGGCDGVGAAASEKLWGRCDDWERMMVVRMGDLGWYRWQDSTVLDGSVVRLWDDPRRRRAIGGGW